MTLNKFCELNDGYWPKTIVFKELFFLYKHTDCSEYPCHLTLRSSCHWWISTLKTTGCTSCPQPFIQSAAVATPPTRRRRWWPGECGNWYNNQHKENNASITGYSSISNVLLQTAVHVYDSHWAVCIRLCLFISLLPSLCLSPSIISHLSFISFPASLSTSSSLLSLNLFSLFCKLGVLVRNRISLFGKEVHANASTSAPSLLLFSVSVSAAWLFSYYAKPGALPIPQNCPWGKI